MSLVSRLIPGALRSAVTRRINAGNIRRLVQTQGEDGQRFADVIRRLERLDSHEGEEWITRIEACRAERLASEERMIDKTGIPLGPFDREDMTVGYVCQASKPKKAALLLYLLVRAFKPKSALEMGTNIGISSAYQAAALKVNQDGGKLMTLDASPCRNALARDSHKTLGLDNVAYKVGVFTESLKPALDELGTLDYAFIDGHHEYQPTLDYFDLIYQHAEENTLVVFDDIRWSDGMIRVWKQFQQDPRIRVALDLRGVGVCIIRKPVSSSDSNAKPFNAVLYNLL